jgi:peptidoglycan/xylan/chitin deacetylase (PgdA/CDA1 family)/folate-dependent phosphoribosylglycinamide formyltransferase PurN
MRLVVYSSVAPQVLQHLLWRLALDLPEAQVAGVLYETARPPLSASRRLKRVVRLLRDPQFVRYAAHTVRRGVAARAGRLFDGALRFVHAAPAEPNGPPLSLEALAAQWRERGVAFHVTGDLHDAESLAFVRALGADLGLIYGTRILKPALFAIPRRGSINIHKHKLPDYRGGGAAGLWEMADDCTEQTVTVHRVVEEVDAGAILGERTIAIEPLDTLESVQMKADVVSVDLIVDVIRDEALGRASERPQPPGGRLYKGCQPHQQHAIECRIRASRKPWRPTYMRPLLKRVARLPLLPLQAVRNHRRRRTKSFPIIVLFQHLTADREKHMSLPTAQFARHVRYLKKHYRIVSLDRAVELLKGGAVDVPTIVLTLDDGYAENFKGLRAIAELEQVPFTVGVCTQHVTERSELAHDIARGEHGFPSLGWDEVRYLDRHGIAIASHTRTHFDCGTGDYARLGDEIAGSKRDLETELGHPVSAFAFPKGMPQNIPPLANGIALQHYPVVLSAACGPNIAPMHPPMEIRRYGHPDSLLELELQVQELLDPPVPPRPVPEGFAFPSAAVPSARG